VASSEIRVVEYLASGRLRLIDQRALPREERYVECASAAETADAIRDMVVRGAPAIGVAAAYGVAVEARRGGDLEAAFARLAASRPTAVNLFHAIDRMKRVTPRTAEGLEMEARRYDAENRAACEAMGRFGAELIPVGPGVSNVLTHCNAGALATAGIGSALGVIRAAVEQGKRIAVFADETRPWLQGARLTAWELQKDGIPVTVLPDAAAASLLRRGGITCAVVGADRIARNGDVANKVGTYPLALACREHGVPFYVAAPISTVDLACPDGDRIPIEERSPDEVTHAAGVRIAPAGVAAFNPSFDVTPAKLVTAIVTERGVARPPYAESLAALAGARSIS
jgi:methylthioribose-1-phosphate isomerase